MTLAAEPQEEILLARFDRNLEKQSKSQSKQGLVCFPIGVRMENEPTVVYVLFFTDSLYSKLCKVKHFGRDSIWFRRDRGKLDVLKLSFGYSETSMQSRLRSWWPTGCDMAAK